MHNLLTYRLKKRDLTTVTPKNVSGGVRTETIQIHVPLKPYPFIFSLNFEMIQILYEMSSHPFAAYGFTFRSQYSVLS